MKLKLFKKLSITILSSVMVAAIGLAGIFAGNVKLINLLTGADQAVDRF